MTKEISIITLEIIDSHGNKIVKECHDWDYSYVSGGISLYEFKQNFEEGEEEPLRHLIARYNNISSFEKIEPLQGVEKEKK